MHGDSRSLQGTITLVLGGVRSGKSRFAQDLAAKIGGDDVLFVATAETLDEEMVQRVEHHRRARPSKWQTIEQPMGTGVALQQCESLPLVTLVDCLTLLVSNILCAADVDAFSIDELLRRVESEVDTLIDIATRQPKHLIIVSGEVGLGIVPEHAMGRTFRDLLGWANQRIAKSATRTLWMVAGLPMDITELSASLEHTAAKLLKTIESRRPSS